MPPQQSTASIPASRSNETLAVLDKMELRNIKAMPEAKVRITALLAASGVPVVALPVTTILNWVGLGVGSAPVTCNAILLTFLLKVIVCGEIAAEFAKLCN
ncbi:MAG: hypothetical protein RL571_474 [Pseudomonadota bacterium]|jgi:hypothetical protein